MSIVSWIILAAIAAGTIWMLIELGRTPVTEELPPRPFSGLRGDAPKCEGITADELLYELEVDWAWHKKCQAERLKWKLEQTRNQNRHHAKHK